MLTLWLKKVKECLAEIWKATLIPLLDENSSVQQRLIQIIWTSAESPVSLMDFSIKLISLCRQHLPDLSEMKLIFCCVVTHRVMRRLRCNIFNPRVQVVLSKC